MVRCVLLSLCFALPAIAQNPPGYDVAYNAAKSRGKPLAIFVNCDGRSIFGSEVMECRRFPGVVGAALILAIPNPAGGEYLRYDLPATATDADIRSYFPLPPKPTATAYREYFPKPTAKPVVISQPVSDPYRLLFSSPPVSLAPSYYGGDNCVGST